MIRRLRTLFSLPPPAPKIDPVFAIPGGIRVYAIGDIHGRSGLLQNMLKTIEQDASAHSDKRIIQVFLGDYIDRGMQSREVIELLLAPAPEEWERIYLRGNHEETLLQFLKEPEILRMWANYGGYTTLASYWVDIPQTMSLEKLFIMRDMFRKNLPATHKEFLKNLRLTYSIGDYLFVHAGLHPGLALHEQGAEHLLWIRDLFLRHDDYFDHYVVHGHSPVRAPDIRHNRANLDISAAEKDSLCCLVLEGIERKTLVVTSQSD